MYTEKKQLEMEKERSFAKNNFWVWFFFIDVCIVFLFGMSKAKQTQKYKTLRNNTWYVSGIRNDFNTLK